MSSTSRNSKATPLKEAIDEFLKTYNLEKKYNETYLAAYWENIMGKSIASRTQKIFVRDQVLYLQISSSPLRQELVLAKTKMIDLINKELKGEVVKEVVFI